MEKFKNTLVITPYLLGQGSTFHTIAQYWEKKWDAQLLGDYFYQINKEEYFTFQRGGNVGLRMKSKFSEKSAYRSYVEEGGRIQSVYVYSRNKKGEIQENLSKLELLKKNSHHPTLVRIRPLDFVGEVKSYFKKNYQIVFAYSRAQAEHNLWEYAALRTTKKKEASRFEIIKKAGKEIKLTRKDFNYFASNIEAYNQLMVEFPVNHLNIFEAETSSIESFFTSLGLSDWSLYYNNSEVEAYNKLATMMPVAKIKSLFSNQSEIERWKMEIFE